MGPLWSEGPQNGILAARALTRRCRADRGRRGWRAALLQLGRWGPSDLDHGDGAVPELLVEASYDGGREQLQLGGPGGRVGAHHQPAVGEDSGVQWAATSSPTSSAQRPKTPWTFRSSSQPWLAISRPIAWSSSCGSRSSGRAPEVRGPPRRRGELGRRTPLLLDVGVPGPRRGRAGAARARSRPSSRCSRRARPAAAALRPVGRRRDVRVACPPALTRHGAPPRRPPRTARPAGPPARRPPPRR